MEIKLLRSFLSTYDLESMTRAAKELNTVQPAISQHIKKLEHSIGQSLFDRGAHGIKPTQVGKRFAEHARRIIEAVDRAQADISRHLQQPMGDVKVGLPGSICPLLAIPLIQETKARFPEVNLLLVEHMSGYLIESLENRSLDIALAFGMQPTHSYSCTELLTESLHAIGKPGTFDANKKTIPAKDLAKLKLVSTQVPHGLRLLLNQWSHETSIPLNIDLEVDSKSALFQLVEEGHYTSIMSQWAIQQQLNRGVMENREVIDPPIRRVLCLCVSRLLAPSPAREAVTSLLKELICDYFDDTQFNAKSG